MAEKKEAGGVKVVDRRGAKREEPPKPAPRTPAADKAVSAAVEGDADDEFKKVRDPTCDEPIPAIDFVTFILSLSTNAMVSLGLLPRPESGDKKRDLPLARQTIDILALLQEKTRGNLSGEEERILDSVLYDLRMTYVQVVRENC
jgi:hypothetical protein